MSSLIPKTHTGSGVLCAVTIPKEVLLKKIPKFWAEAIQDKLRLHGLQLGMKIKYIPKMNKYLVVEK